MNVTSKDIGKYIIHSDGRIWTKIRNKFLTPIKTKDGYHSVKIGLKTKKVHRVVYEAFRGEIPDRLEIDHINGNRTDNRIENLEAVTHKENIRRAVINGSYSNNPLRMGQMHGRSVLNDINVLTILTMPKRKPNGQKPGWSNIELAKIYGVSNTRISNIRNGREWKHLQ